MTNVQLLDSGKGGNGLNIEVVEGMSRVKPHAGALDGLSRPSNGRELPLHLRPRRIPTLGVEDPGIGAGVHLADLNPQRVCRSDLVQIWINEGAYCDSRSPEGVNHGRQMPSLSDKVQPTLGRDLLSALRHQHGHLRLDLKRKGDHLPSGRHLEIELDLGMGAQASNVIILDMPPVFSEMDGDAVGSAMMGLYGRPDRVGIVAASGLTKAGHMVDIDSKLNHDFLLRTGPHLRQGSHGLTGGQVLSPQLVTNQAPQKTLGLMRQLWLGKTLRKTGQVVIVS